MYEVVDSVERFSGHAFGVVTDSVVMPDGRVAARDVVRHVGAVALVALDEQGRVVLVNQYRHPVRRRLWELPAGLVDVAGEDLPQVAVRELAEETDLVAARLDLLVDVFTSPGCSSEMIRIFLARGLSDVPADQRHVRDGEEADLRIRRVPLDEAVAMVLSGEITNGPAVAGLLVAARVRDVGFEGLRVVDAPLPPLSR